LIPSTGVDRSLLLDRTLLMLKMF